MRLWRRAWVALALGVGLVAGWLAWGGYDVGASSSPNAVEEWLLTRVRDRSVARRAQAITVPALGAPEQVRQGFELYRALCRGCHGGAGGWPEEPAMGLHPVPPGLSLEKVQRRPDAELFWITKHGLRFTGMPAFGALHGDDEIWALVTFVRALPKLSPEDLERLAAATEP